MQDIGEVCSAELAEELDGEISAWLAVQHLVLQLEPGQQPGIGHFGGQVEGVFEPVADAVVVGVGKNARRRAAQTMAGGPVLLRSAGV